MIDHKQNRENIIRDLKLNLIGPSPTGKPIKMQFSDFWLIKDGKFSENFVMVDNYSVLKQMGLSFS